MQWIVWILLILVSGYLVASRLRRRSRVPGKPRHRILVKFRAGPGVHILEVNGQLTAKGIDLTGFFTRVSGSPLASKARVRQVFPRMSRAIRQRELQGTLRSRRRSEIDLYVAVEFFEDVSQQHLEALRESLGELTGEVERSYIPLPPGDRPSMDWSGDQEYLLGPPGGIGADYAEEIGADGSLVNVCVIDSTYYESHEDLPEVRDLFDTHLDSEDDEYHGNRVLGVLVALTSDPEVGVKGICPGATAVFGSDSLFNVEDLLDEASENVLTPGDVIVLESNQIPVGGVDCPPEAHAAVHEAIRTATEEFGVVVVEPAANGNHDLAGLVDESGKPIWDLDGAGYVEAFDSWAIMVGAGYSPSSPNPRYRNAMSNYGKRVNCQAWGENVVTIGASPGYDVGFVEAGGRGTSYVGNFDGTSSAGAIVGGIVACLQGLVKAGSRLPLPALKIRGLLANPALGTKQPDADAAVNPIGPMPDLNRLLEAAANVFVRDNLGDGGEEPRTDLKFESPDIIYRNTIVPHPELVFGTGTWGDGALSESVTTGPRFVYARMENRAVVSGSLDIAVYWAPASTFLHPSDWVPIGVMPVGAVGPLERRVHSTPLPWGVPLLKSNVCFIAVAKPRLDTVDIPDDTTSMEDLADFIKQHNYISYRNVEYAEASVGAAIPPYVFFLRGAPAPPGGPTTDFRIEFHHHFPPGAGFDVTVDGYALHILGTAGGITDAELKVGAGRVRVTERYVVVKRASIGSGKKIQVSITPVFGTRRPPGVYSLYVDQFLGLRHLGRVTYSVSLHS